MQFRGHPPTEREWLEAEKLQMELLQGDFELEER